MKETTVSITNGCKQFLRMTQKIVGYRLHMSTLLSRMMNCLFITLEWRIIKALSVISCTLKINQVGVEKIQIGKQNYPLSSMWKKEKDYWGQSLYRNGEYRSIITLNYGFYYANKMVHVYHNQYRRFHPLSILNLLINQLKC